jgi:hypothetical protein
MSVDLIPGGFMVADGNTARVVMLWFSAFEFLFP